MNLIEQLKPLQEQLCSKVSKRYKYNPQLNDFFSYENLISISNEIIVSMINNESIEPSGIYNYFRNSFSYKCQDLYKKHITKKRDHLLIDNFKEDTNDLSITLDEEISKKSLLDEIKIILKKIDISKNKPYLSLFDYICLGYNIQEIAGLLNLSESMIKKHKRDMINELNKIFAKNKENYFINFDSNELIIFDKSLKSNPPIKQYIIETSYKEPNYFAKLILMEITDFDQKHIQEIYCSNEKDYNEKYLKLKDDLKLITSK